MTDWADEIERQAADLYSSHGAILAADADGFVAAALRKAKADGMRALAHEMTAHQQQILREADKIEKGEL